jgi:hypothetical protein
MRTHAKHALSCREREEAVALPIAAARFAAVSAHADLVGSALVIDGDTIVINSEHVRLKRSTRPRRQQTCKA